MCSSHNFGGHCGGNTYFSNFVSYSKLPIFIQKTKKAVTSTVPSKVMRRTHVNMNLSSLQVVNHHFTVNCHFTLVNCCFTVIHRFTVKRRFTVNRFERPLAEDNNFFHYHLRQFVINQFVSFRCMIPYLRF